MVSENTIEKTHTLNAKLAIDIHLTNSHQLQDYHVLALTKFEAWDPHIVC